MGIHSYIFREYGYAEKGETVLGKVAGRKFKRVNIVSALRNNKPVAPMLYESSMTSQLFETWFSENLLPQLEKGSVIIMDNASFHRKQKLITLAEKAKMKIIFLPPYSPEYNTIEKYWANLKRKLRNTLPSFSSFDEALEYCLKVC